MRAPQSPLVLWGTVFHWTFDEGIYLSGAERVLRGQVPFRDFWSITGPGSYYLYALVMAAFGRSYLVARLVLCIEIGMICACMYYVVHKLSGRAGWALSASPFFLGMCAAVSFRIWVNHRWDSSAALLLAICLVLSNRPLVAGCLAALACCFTPALGPVALIVGVGSGWQPMRRFLAGWGLVVVAVACGLGWLGAIPDMLEQVLV